MLKIGFLFSVVFVLASCVRPSVGDVKADRDSLYQYAQANCLFWYFNEKGYDTDDIRAIAGGIVEHSDISSEKFQEISLFVKAYSPQLGSKNNIDVSLNKCFHLKESEELQKIIDK